MRVFDTPPSLSQLAVLYAAVVAALILGLGAFFWHELEHTTATLRAHEARAAQAEVADALAMIRSRTAERAATLAGWEETRQQLAYPGFYSLWLDHRVRDAGKLPAGVVSVALYDRQGMILPGAHGTNPMPARLPGTPPLATFVREAGDVSYFKFVPVHADPGGSVLLGYLGLKVNLAEQLAQLRVYRYADISRLEVHLPPGRVVGAGQLLNHLHVEALPNIEVHAFDELFRQSLGRLAVTLLAALALATLLLDWLMVRPLRDLSREIDALRDTAAAEALRPRTMPVLELEKVRNSVIDYQTRLAQLHQNLAESSRVFFEQAHRDALTGVYNRRAFDADWRDAVLDRRQGELALILLDCDHFKAINDTYGHNVGDAVIQAVARCLQAALRANDRLYRIGGDEFATVLAATDAQQAQSVAERCLSHVMAHDFRQYGINEPLTISIGVALASPADDDRPRASLTVLQRHADLAMYAAKRPGGQKIVFHCADIDSAQALVANHVINGVFQAIRDPELIRLAYQPVVSLPGLKADYAEALVRIRFEDDILTPGQIFPVVQGRNLDVEFDLAVIRALNRDLDSGRLAPGQGVSVNISAQGMVNARIIDTLVALVAAEPGRKIVVEITETALIAQMDVASANIRRLREAGAVVALDDFGSGYSSLRYLASMPVDLVKFDISMVRLLESGNATQRLMIEEITHLVNAAGYQTVAEGIETRTLLEKVIRIGFSHAQGYYLGKPG